MRRHPRPSHQPRVAIAEPAFADRLDRIAAEAAAVAQSAGSSAKTPPPRVKAAKLEEEDPGIHIDRVARAKEYIRAGDIYQANIARPVARNARAGRDGARSCTRRLRAANPAPFAALAQWGGASIVSSSPERLARIFGDRRIDTRPSRARALAVASRAATWPEMTELAAHPKERAEHVMLIDLERNDLGRVCEAGTVRVDEFMTIESYAHVHHIVSNVSGRLRGRRHPHRCNPCGISGRNHHRMPQSPLHGDHRGARGLGARFLHRLARLPRAGRHAWTPTSSFAP